MNFQAIEQKLREKETYISWERKSESDVDYFDGFPVRFNGQVLIGDEKKGYKYLGNMECRPRTYVWSNGNGEIFAFESKDDYELDEFPVKVYQLKANNKYFNYEVYKEIVNDK